MVKSDRMVDGLIFPVDQIPPDGLSGRRILAPAWFALPPEADQAGDPIKLLEPILVDFRLERSGRDVRLHLTLSTAASLACARCLKAFRYPVHTRTDFTFCRVSHSTSLESEAQLTLEDLESAPFEGDEVDISDLIYEQIVLSFPIKPLCHGECKGICPHCGVDRNSEDCGCIAERLDPRWEVLRKLKLGV